MGWAFANGSGPAGSLRGIAGGARHRICIAAPAISMEGCGSVVVGLRDVSRHLLLECNGTIHQKRANWYTRPHRESAASLGTRYFCRNRIVPFDFSCLHGRQLRE